MPFPSVATHFIVSLTIHVGAVVLSAPGYSATFHTQPPPAVVVTLCRTRVAETYLRPRSLAGCAPTRTTPSPELRARQLPGANRVDLAGVEPPVTGLAGLSWRHRPDALRETGRTAVPVRDVVLPPTAGLRHEWLTLQWQ